MYIRNKDVESYCDSLLHQQLKSIKLIKHILFSGTVLSFQYSSVLVVCFLVRGSMLNNRQLSVLSLAFWVGSSLQYKEQRLSYTTFAGFDVTSSIETNGFDHIARGTKYIPRSIIYSLPTFIHTHGDISPAESPSFAVNLQQFTLPLYMLSTAQMVLLWFT